MKKRFIQFGITVLMIIFLPFLLFASEAEMELRKAVANHDLVKIKELLRQNDLVDTSIGSGFTSLMVAAATGDVDVARILLDNGASVDLKEFGLGQTALIIAANAGESDMVKLLLENKANIEATEKMANCTSLILAAMAGHAPVVQVLIDNGANVNAKGLGNGTALFGAAAKGHTNVVEILLSNGADVNARFENGMTPLSIA